MKYLSLQVDWERKTGPAIEIPANAVRVPFYQTAMNENRYQNGTTEKAAARAAPLSQVSSEGR